MRSRRVLLAHMPVMVLLVATHHPHVVTASDGSSLRGRLLSTANDVLESADHERQQQRRAQAGAATMPAYTNRDIIARFLEQATFGPTRESIDDIESNYESDDFARWIADQMDETITPPTLHRAFYRTNANARFEFPYNGGAVTHPCERYSIYRRYALSQKDSGRQITLQTSGGAFRKLIIGGFVRTLVTSAQISQVGANPPNLVAMPDNVPYELCNIQELYIDDGDIKNSFIGVKYLSDVACTYELWLNGKSGNAAIIFDMNTAIPNHMLNLNDESSQGHLVEERMTAYYGGVGRTPAVQEVALTEDVYEQCHPNIGMTGNPENPVFLLYQNQFWIHDARFTLLNNTVDEPLPDGGGALAKTTENIAVQNSITLTGFGDADRIKCSNVPRSFVNEAGCRRSTSPDICGGSEITCGSPGEVANDLSLGGEGGAAGGAFDINTLKHKTRTLQYLKNARIDVWLNIALKSSDQLRQRGAWALSQILVISPTSLEQTETMSEVWLAYYDIFTRHAFGNYRDVLKEVSYSPMMSEMLTYVDGASTASVLLDTKGSVQYPDENYAREIMQLFTIGLRMMHRNGTEILDANGEGILTYTNADIEEHARLWTGFTRQPARGNMETNHVFNRIDPMYIDPLKRDLFPKLGLFNQHVGDGYPLCTDLPERHFLKAGAKYRLVNSNGQPELQVDSAYWVDEVWLSGTAQRMSAEPSGNLYAKLCESNNGECQYPIMVELDTDLICAGDECTVDTIRTIQVENGVFYEYIRPPCVEQAFYEGGKKVVPYDYLSGPHRVGGAGTGDSGFIMCANPQLEVANTACCSSTPYNADSYNAYASGQMYWGERLRYATAETRCAEAQQQQSHCALPHMGAFCGSHIPITEGCSHIWYSNNLQKADGAKMQTHYWTDDDCHVQAKFDLRSGKVGIVHSTSQDDSMLAAHVQMGSKTLFRVDWGTTTLVDVAAAVTTSPACAAAGGAATRICDVTVLDEVVFTDAPSSVEDVLLNLSIGAFHPSATAPSGSSVQSSSFGDVTLYYIESNGLYSVHTVFEVTDEYGRTQFRRNMKSSVSIDGTGLTFRNPVHFISLVNPEPRDMYYETDAALDQYFFHPNVAPFLAYRFAQRFGISNPSSRYVENIADAFVTGSYESFGSGSYGDLSALVAAVLLDEESRDTAMDNEPSHGALGEPLIRLIKLMRALEFNAAPHHRLTSFRSPGAIGQMVHLAPSVFSFFLPEYAPAGTRISREGYKSPEAQLNVGPNIMSLLNSMYSTIRFGLDECYYGLASWSFDRQGVCRGELNWGNFTYTPALKDSAGAVDELATLMTAGRLSLDNRAIVKELYNSASADPSDVDPLILAQQVIATSSEFHSLGGTHVKSGEPRPAPATLNPLPPSLLGTQYKAVVFLMLAGGYDSWNLLVPHTCQGMGNDNVRTQYENERGILALTDKERLGTIIDVDQEKEERVYGSEGTEPCSQYAVHPEASLLRDLFRDGDLSFFANAGALSEPLSKGNYNEKMRQLFAHNTMQNEAKRIDPFDSRPDTGVLGRAMAVISNTTIPGSVRKYNVNSASIDVLSVAVKGAPNPRVVSRQGPAPFNPAAESNSPWDILPIIQSINNGTSDDSNMYGELWSSSMIDAIAESEEMGTFLDGINLKTGDAWGTGSDWWEHMMTMVLKLIHTRSDRQVDRDVFYIELSNWDHHSKTKENFSEFMTRLNTTLSKFTSELKKEGIWDQVALVSFSDFGRTLVPNTGGGSDHAWGGHYFVMGGSVDGGQIHGQYPSDITDAGELNVGGGRGRIIPTLSWESILNGIVEWLGVDGEENLDICMPNRINTGTTLFRKSDVFDSPEPRMTYPPTVIPTKTPTPDPEKSPTPQPTDTPTNRPVELPTDAPTLESTTPPTTLPTMPPTKTPIMLPPSQLTNLARGKSTSQSATPLYPAGQASNAVDGNTDGLWWNGSVSHNGGNGWWQVDLGDLFPIHSIKIYNRMDCCKEKLNTINVVIFNQYFHVLTVKTLSTSSADVVNWHLDEPLIGRHVQIQNPHILHMAEVEVYGVAPSPPPTLPPSAVANVALGKATLQSATPLYPAGQASNAVDGNTDGLWWNGSVSHNGGNGWWQVDLGDLFPIHSIKIYNRMDCCKEKLNTINVVIFNQYFHVLTVKTLSTSSADVVNWHLDEPLIGRHVQIQNPHILHMAEVEVYALL